VDGRGIPDGLGGEAIPLEARIVAVADAFDAMTSRRPYRPGYRLSVPDAIDELRRHAGTQFDLEALSAFLGAIESGDVDLTQLGGGSEIPHVTRGIRGRV
jgi:HD-GYP domain-containing protein (c-di-GMP phosphodiesterase class II)